MLINSLTNETKCNFFKINACCFNLIMILKKYTVKKINLFHVFGIKIVFSLNISSNLMYLKYIAFGISNVSRRVTQTTAIKSILNSTSYLA